MVVCVYCGHDVYREDGRVRHSVKKFFTYIAREDYKNGSYKHSVMECKLECGAENKDGTACDCFNACDLDNLLQIEMSEINFIFAMSGEIQAKLKCKEYCYKYNLTIDELFNKATKK